MWNIACMKLARMKPDVEPAVNPSLSANAGQVEEKQHVLNEKDSMWVDLRHKHFADAINDISSQARDNTSFLPNACGAVNRCSGVPAQCHMMSVSSNSMLVSFSDENCLAPSICCTSVVSAKPDSSSLTTTHGWLGHWPAAHCKARALMVKVMDPAVCPQMTEFTAKNAAARHRPQDGSQLDVRDMRRLVQALPQYRCSLFRLRCHLDLDMGMGGGPWLLP